MKLHLEVKGRTNIDLSEDIRVTNCKFSHLISLDAGESLTDKIFDMQYQASGILYEEGEVEVIIEEINVLKVSKNKKWIKK